jgi:putative flippase GtrA
MVGVFNTFFGYSIFVIIQLTVGHFTSYWVSLYGSFFAATLVAFPIHRRFTFRVEGTGHVFQDFFRFQGINLIALAVNSIALPLLVERTSLNPIVAQGSIVISTTLISYFGHKFFTFHRSSQPSTLQSPEVNDGK